MDNLETALLTELRARIATIEAALSEACNTIVVLQNTNRRLADEIERCRQDRQAGMAAEVEQ